MPLYKGYLHAWVSPILEPSHPLYTGTFGILQKFFKKRKKRLDFLKDIHYNGLASTENDLALAGDTDGELAEWSKAHDWKSCRRDERL